jgi:hypothetical protein
MIRIYLQFCSSSDILEVEQRHYVEKMMENDPNAKPNSVGAGEPKGHHGQQIHYLIWGKTENGWWHIGAISGGSGVFSCGVRDKFFGLDKFPKPKRGQTSPYLSGIIDNTLYHLDLHEKNLASKVLSLWRKQVAKDWEFMYGVKPYGFETFVDEKRSNLPGFNLSKGGLYVADNWTCVGTTSGSAKDHVGKGLTGGLRGEPFRRRKVPIKIAYCRWIAPFTEPQFCEYKSSWRGQTPEEKALAKERANRRKELLRKALTELPEECNLRMRDSSK